MKLELVPVPVADVDRARAFYRHLAGGLQLLPSIIATNRTG
jgi:hypothetical protein